MNEFTHFFTGYVIARALGYKHTRFETFFIAFASLIPDMDFTISIFFYIEHGVFTHTLIGGAIVTLIIVGITWFIKIIVNSKNPELISIKFKTLFGLAMLGMVMHLVVDSFTYYETAADAIHHLYFWPVWNFPVHINTMFPGTTYETRVLVEVIYTVLIVGIILFYQWAYRKENPFESFLPWSWQNKSWNRDASMLKPRWIKTIVIVISIMVLVLGYLFLDIVFALVFLEGFLGITCYFDLRRSERPRSEGRGILGSK